MRLIFVLQTRMRTNSNRIVDSRDASSSHLFTGQRRQFLLVHKWALFDSSSTSALSSWRRLLTNGPQPRLSLAVSKRKWKNGLLVGVLMAGVTAAFLFPLYYAKQINQSIHPSINQSIIKSINQSTNQPTNQPTKQTKQNKNFACWFPSLFDSVASFSI